VCYLGGGGSLLFSPWYLFGLYLIFSYSQNHVTVASTP
jgi:hypothetical protein